MQPSSAFNVLKQFRKTGKWQILDNTSNVAHDQKSGASVVSVSDLNKDTEVMFRRLKSIGSELEVTAVSNFDEIMKVGKENIDVECVNSIDNFVKCTATQVHREQAKHHLLNDGRSVRTDENVDEVDTCDGCDADAVKVSNATKKQRTTFSLRAEVLPCSTAQMQSDSIDVNLLGEVADIYQRSSELSCGNTDDISTQEIEAHEDKIDGSKQQHCVSSCTESLVPMSHPAVLPVSHNAHHRQEADAPQLPVTHQPSPMVVTAVAGSMTASQLSHSAPISAVTALQCSDVDTLSVTLHGDVANNSSELPNNTNLNTVASSNDNSEQLCMPAAAAAGVNVHRCTADAIVACRDEGETSDVRVAVVDDNSCETKQSYSDEVFNSQVADTSDVDSELGEYFTAIFQIPKFTVYVRISVAALF